MKVVILKTNKSIGVAGEVKDVKDGYALNFLIPQGLAKKADTATIEAIQTAKKSKVKKDANTSKEYKKLAAQLNNYELGISAKADEKDTLFGGIHEKEIVEALNDKGFEISKENVAMKEPLKKIGTHPVTLIFGDESATLKLTVSRES